ncbi:MAG: hypothetical protein PHP82_01000 [Candidatus ainarchaeum sp.]|nr:hypothetical protein [Candidatus ainarchaeum sp.]
MNLKKFFEPSWKKLKWFFLVFFIAQFYSNVIMPFIPTIIMQEFINFILNPTTIILNTRGIEQNILQPIIITLNAVWNYVLATLITKEVNKEK